jgi:hypothetical protein
LALVVSYGRAKEASMASLLEALQAREQQARARVETLRAELDRLAEQIAGEEELLRRLEITRQTVLEVLAGDDLHGAADVGLDGGKVSASQHQHQHQHQHQQEAARLAAAPAGMGVPVFVADGDVDGRRLPVAYRDVVEVVAQAGPLRPAQVCKALGIGDEPRHREGMRGKLKRLVDRGWLVETAPGLFAAVGGVADHLAAAGDREGAATSG